MKKLMMAAAIVCAAAFAHAGTVAWGSPYGINVIGQSGDTADLFNGTVYLISGDAATFYSAAIENYSAAIAAATVLSSATQNGMALESPTVGAIDSDGRVAGIAAETGTLSAFMTAIDAKGDIYISETLTDSIPTTGAVTYDYYGDAAYAGTKYQMPVEYSGAGWYAVKSEEPIPEPTSGLLLVLGLAGLALKRKHA